MGVWWKLFGFAKPYWRRLALSMVFGIFTAVLWSAALSLTFPVVKVFLQGQHLAEYVQQELDSAERDLQNCQTELDQFTTDLATVPADSRNPERVRLLNASSRAERKLNTLASRVWLLHWTQANLLPLLPRDELRLLSLVFLVQLAVTALKGLSMYCQDVLVGCVGELAIIDLRKALFRRVLKLDPQTVALRGHPQLMARMTSDLQSLAGGLSLLGADVVREPLKALACILLAFWVNWQLTTLSLIFVPLAGLMFWKLSHQLKRAMKRLFESVARVFQTLEETFHAAKFVIASHSMAAHRRQFQRENRDFFQKSLKIVRMEALTGPATEILGMLAVLAALLPGAYLVLNHVESIGGIRLANSPMDIAELSVLYTLLAGTLDPVRKFSKFFTRIKQTSVAADRVFELFDLESQTPEPIAPKLLPRVQSSIEFQQIQFSYARGDQDVSARPAALRDVTLKVRAGETIAVVGGNGSGKSTLVNLLLRFYDPDEGAVLLDGVDLRELRTRDLRAQLAVVSQETILFDETIAENIRYGRPDATVAEIYDAACKAHVIDFTEQLPEGIDTPVGAGGRALSGGQRQRIALARAMLRNPSLLILDEPTSAIDAHSEALIQQSLKKFVAGRTTFLVTHCLTPALLEFIDRIAVLDRGILIGLGTHAELLATCPLYTRLYAAQTQTIAA